MKLLIMGRSGVGKSTLANYLTKYHGLKQLDSYTTRPMRVENETGHTFITEKEVQGILEEEGCVAKTTINGYLYFATKKQVEDCDIYLIDPHGLKSLLKAMPDTQFMIVYVTADLHKRIQYSIERSDNPEEEEKVIKERIASEDAQFDRFEDQMYLHNNLSLHECYLEMLSGSADDVGITSTQRYTQEEFMELVAEENEIFGQNVTDIRLFYNDIRYNYSAIEKTEPDTIKNEPISKFGDELADCLRLDKKIKQFIDELIAFDIVKTSYNGSVIVNSYGTTEAISKDLFAGMLAKDDALLSRYTKEYLMRRPYRH